MATANVWVNKGGPKQIGDPGDAGIGALQLALLRSADQTAHQGHGCRALQSPKRQQRDTDAKFNAGSRHSEYQEPDNAERKTEHERGAFADRLGDRADDRALHHDRADADDGKRQAHEPLVPAVAIHQIEDADARQHGVGEIAEEIDGGEP